MSPSADQDSIGFAPVPGDRPAASRGAVPPADPPVHPATPLLSGHAGKSDPLDPSPQPALPPPPLQQAPHEPRVRTHEEQQLRMLSALVLLLAVGLFLALPFVFSIGSVVFLPVVAAIVMTILLSPLADRLAMVGLPNWLASLLALLVLVAIIVLALTVVLRPAITLFDTVPQMIERIGQHFNHVQGTLTWVSRLNEQVQRIAGSKAGREVVLAGPSVLQQLALATPTVVLELLLTLLMTFFMIESRVRLRRRLLLDRIDFGSSLKAARVMRDVQDRVAAYIFTVGMINVAVGVVVAFGAWVLGLQAPIMWGGLATLLNFLPYVGPLTMAGLLTLFGLGTADNPMVGMIPAAAFLALHTVEANAITPAVLGARFTVNPVMILVSLSYFTWIWGVTGALLSVPILLTLTAMVEHLGKPNVIGFLFGENLFSDRVIDPDEVYLT